MGVIMRGEHIKMKRDVAVKLLSPDIATEAGYRARFLREVDLAATIEHPNIVRCYDFGETADGVLYLVMELLEGESLKETLHRERRMSTRRVAALLLQSLDGMATAHLQAIVHRDLKPSNIYIVQDHRGEDVVKVLDFGLAKSLTADHLTLTKTGAVCGTASYVAPESLVLQQVGTEGDIYAVGLIALEMLIGRQVCQSRAMAQTFLQHLVVPARIPRRVWDTPLGPILARALMKHPADRYANAEEMFQALRAVEADIPDVVLAPSEMPPLPPENLDNSLLMQLGDGKYSAIDALHELPAPEPWDLDDGVPDDVATLQDVMFHLEQQSDAQWVEVPAHRSEQVTVKLPGKVPVEVPDVIAAPPDTSEERHTPRVDAAVHKVPTKPTKPARPVHEELPTTKRQWAHHAAPLEKPLVPPIAPAAPVVIADPDPDPDPIEARRHSPLIWVALCLAAATLLILILN